MLTMLTMLTMSPMHALYQKAIAQNTESSTLDSMNKKNLKTLGSTRECKSRETQRKARPVVKTLFFLVLFFPLAVWYQQIFTTL